MLGLWMKNNFVLFTSFFLLKISEMTVDFSRFFEAYHIVSTS